MALAIRENKAVSHSQEAQNLNLATESKVIVVGLSRRSARTVCSGALDRARCCDELPFGTTLRDALVEG